MSVIRRIQNIGVPEDTPYVNSKNKRIKNKNAIIFHSFPNSINLGERKSKNTLIDLFSPSNLSIKRWWENRQKAFLLCS